VKRHGPDDARSAAGELGVALSEDGTERLIAYEALLQEKAIPLGFVARSDEDRLWERHILDSLRASVDIQQGDRLALDLGSGAGLPGVVLAIAAPQLHVGLVESRLRRVAFLELVVERLQLANAEIVPERAQALEEGRADVCTARAFAPADRAWTIARPLLSEAGRLIYFAGAEAVLEAPDGARIVSSRPGPLESSGALVIMTR
jgi:16S rRNA (guanine527-N7)-methyltransferase